MSTETTILEPAAAGSLLGTAVGDALGLACEALSRRRQLKMYPSLDHYGLLFGKGLCSDDTEHACMTAQALISSQGNTEIFSQRLASKLRWWFAALPAGIGLATLKACCKLWLGFSPERSGVVSAGNGPAMRAPIIGVLYGHDPQQLRQLIRCSTQITHRDRRAEEGALLVALAAQLASRGQDIRPEVFSQHAQALLATDSPWLPVLAALIDSVQQSESIEDYAAKLGCAQQVSGYILHTVPVVLHLWLNHQHDFDPAIRQVIRLGGDTDTTAAILGGIIGARVGVTGIPLTWRQNLIEWPRHVAYIEQLGQQAARSTQIPCAELSLNLPALLLRNLLFMLIVLAHGFRRLLPPY